MTQQVQELIDKIKVEGVEQAEAQAKEIESRAKAQADRILEESKKKAGQLLVEVKEQQKRLEETTRASLEQAARDMLLNLRKEIFATLTKIISAEVDQVLTPEQLAGLISQIVKGFLKEQADKKDITVLLSEEDLKKLNDGFTTKLKEGIKHPIQLQSADDISGGFTISFDEGKSMFDFTDEALVEYLSDYVNVEVAALLKQSISSG